MHWKRRRSQSGVRWLLGAITCSEEGIIAHSTQRQELNCRQHTLGRNSQPNIVQEYLRRGSEGNTPLRPVPECRRQVWAIKGHWVATAPKNSVQNSRATRTPWATRIAWAIVLPMKPAPGCLQLGQGRNSHLDIARNSLRRSWVVIIPRKALRR